MRLVRSFGEWKVRVRERGGEGEGAALEVEDIGIPQRKCSLSHLISCISFPSLSFFPISFFLLSLSL